MQKITPFLWFDDQAEEAMNFYVSVFKNSKIISNCRDGAEATGTKEKVMSVKFQLEGQEFIALNGVHTSPSHPPSRSSWTAGRSKK